MLLPALGAVITSTGCWQTTDNNSRHVLFFNDFKGLHWRRCALNCSVRPLSFSTESCCSACEALMSMKSARSEFAVWYLQFKCRGLPRLNSASPMSPLSRWQLLCQLLQHLCSPASLLQQEGYGQLCAQQMPKIQCYSLPCCNTLISGMWVHNSVLCYAGQACHDIDRKDSCKAL